MNFKDKWLICVDCGLQFLWDVGEQAWYHSHHLRNQPKHCKACRNRRREAEMKEPRHYSKVNCAGCGASTFVPFVPRGTKPVYCRSCLRAYA